MNLADEVEVSPQTANRANLLARRVYQRDESLGMPGDYLQRVARLSSVSVRANPGEPEYRLEEKPLARQRFERLVTAACNQPTCFEKSEAKFLRACLLAKAVDQPAIDLIDEMHAQHFGDSPRPAPSLDKTT